MQYFREKLLFLNLWILFIIFSCATTNEFSSGFPTQPFETVNVVVFCYPRYVSYGSVAEYKMMLDINYVLKKGETDIESIVLEKPSGALIEFSAESIDLMGRSGKQIFEEPEGHKIELGEYHLFAYKKGRLRTQSENLPLYAPGSNKFDDTKFVVAEKTNTNSGAVACLREPWMVSLSQDSKASELIVTFENSDERVSNGNLYFYDSEKNEIAHSDLFLRDSGIRSDKVFVDNISLLGIVVVRIPLRNIVMDIEKPKSEISQVTVSLNDGLQYGNRNLWTYRSLSRFLLVGEKITE